MQLSLSRIKATQLVQLAYHILGALRVQRMVGIVLGLSLLLQADLRGDSRTLTYDASGNITAIQEASSGPPMILAQPKNHGASGPNESVSFFVRASSSTQLSYQWRFNGAIIPGATADFLFLPDITEADEGLYSVIVSNSDGSIESVPVRLMIDSNRNGLPDSWEMTHFANLNQTADGDFDDDKVSNGDEFEDDTDPSGNASFMARLTLISAGGHVDVMPQRERYPLGQQVELRAVDGILTWFYGWGGDAYGTANSITVTMNGHKTIYADYSNSDVRILGAGLEPPDGIREIKSVSAGDHHVLALKMDGTVMGWGRNTYGECNVPLDLAEVVAVSAGNGYSIALKTDGNVVAWGDFVPFLPKPEEFKNLVSVTALDSHCVGLTAMGRVVVWGYGRMPPENLSGISALAPTYQTTLALRGDRTVVAWGESIGAGTPPATLTDVVGIAADYGYGLGLKLDGTIVRWGASSALLPLSGVRGISTRSGKSLALMEEGRVATWGQYETTVLRPAGMSPSSIISGGNYVVRTRAPHTPLPVPFAPAPVVAAKKVEFSYYVPTKNGADEYSATGLPPGMAIEETTGRIHGVPQESGVYSVMVTAVNEAGSNSGTIKLAVIPTEPQFGPVVPPTVYAGQPYQFQLGAGGSAADYAATGLPQGLSIDDVTGVVSGTTKIAGLHSVTVTASNEFGVGSVTFELRVVNVIASGYSWEGQTSIPEDLYDPVAIAAGENHSVALKPDGTVVAWGGYTHGQANVPSDLTNVIAIAAGRNHSLALKDDGTVIGWGDSEYWQTFPPSGLTNVAAIAAGHYFSVALKHDGSVVVWGDAGDGIPNIPPGVKDVVAIAAGYYHILVLKADGTVIAWGYNGDGQATVPSGLTGVKFIGAGSHHSLAVKTDGTTVGWGNNLNGQAATQSSASGFGQVTGGFWHSFGVENDGTLRSWGYEGDGTAQYVGGVTRGVAVATGARHSLALLAAPPRVSSVLRKYVLPHAIWTYRIRGSNLPTSYSATNLPPGSAFDSATGVLSGTAPASGVRHISITVHSEHGSDTDSLVLAVIPELDQAVDAQAMTWTTGGNAPWKGQVEFSADGVDAAQSGTVADDDESWIETQVNGPGTLSFSWRVSSEEDWDFLNFLIDGVRKKRIAGASGEWRTENFPIAAGQHTLRWNYVKDEIYSAGLDAGWVDQVIFTPAGGGLPGWKTTHWPADPTGADAADLADPDKDGIVNAMEYALGLHPSQASTSGLPIVTIDDSQLTLTFKRERADVAYLVEESLDLKGWEVYATNPGSVGAVVSVHVPLADEKRKFLRLRIVTGSP